MRISDWSSDVCSSDHARRRTAADLIEQARPRSVGEKAVGTASQQKGFLQRVERPVHRPRARERPVIAPLAAPRPAMLLDARTIVIHAQHDAGKADRKSVV